MLNLLNDICLLIIVPIIYNNTLAIAAPIMHQQYDMTSPMSLLLLAFITVCVTPSALSFSVQSSSPLKLFATTTTSSHNNEFRSSIIHRYYRDIRHRLNLAKNNVADEEDDGWGDDTTVVSNSGSPTESSELPSSSSSSSDRISKSQELARLQNEMAAKQTNRASSSSTSTSNANNGSGERDLFIPIVTIVSVIGFTGLYGYEMLRLYSRGELYLPWEN